MALTGRIRLLRVLSIIQCWMSLWFVVLGIIERSRVGVSFLGFPIWTGILIGITGAVGVQMTFKRQQRQNPHSFSLSPVLLMTFMGFSLTCAALCCLTIVAYHEYLSFYAGRSTKLYNYSGHPENKELVLTDFNIAMGPKEKEDHALVGSIFAITVAELLLALWSVAACLISDQQLSPIASEICKVPLMVVDSQEMDERSTGYVLEDTVHDNDATKIA